MNSTAQSVSSATNRIEERFRKYVIPSYARFDIALTHGEGAYVWDVDEKRYLDLAGGIAVTALGHGNAEIADAIAAQAKKLVHTSNLYFHEGQGQLAEQIVNLVGPGKMFFCNTGAEANEGLFKLARKFGHDEGRFEIITAENSFHGRTLAAISATGQEKVKKGFEPMVQGFKHVPYNDLNAVRAAISPSTVAVLIEGVQGEGGIFPASPEYLIGLRKLCNEKKLLLMMDAVQCGNFRTGRFQSYQRILENTPEAKDFLPDAISMGKSLAGGLPMGAFWVRQPYADLLSAGTHGTTLGGSPLVCAAALKSMEIIQRDKLADNARELGNYFNTELLWMRDKFPEIIKDVRGLGLMIGLELQETIPSFTDSDKTVAAQFVNRLHAAGVLSVPAGKQVIRLLPPLNLKASEAAEAMRMIELVVARTAS
ncbi:MAG: acetylornithine transaminase [Limisphaerales bacterium]